MSDWNRRLREKEIGKDRLIEIQIKALSSPYIYRVLCYYEEILLAKFKVWGIPENKLKELLNKNFHLFNINSEGSGEFYFKKRIMPHIDKLEGWMDSNLEIMDNRDLPITKYELEKLKPLPKEAREKLSKH